MDYSNLNDNELVNLLNENISANDVFSFIYFKYSSQVYGYCLYQSNSKDEADELAQETWIKFYKSINDGKRTNQILPYLLAIARNLAINKFKHSGTNKRRLTENLDYDILEAISDPFNFKMDLEKEEEYKMLNIAINNLDEIYKDVILLYWFGDMKLVEIAKLCNESAPTIRKRFERAMKKISEFLQPYLIQ